MKDLLSVSSQSLFFLRNPGTSVCDLRRVQRVDLCHKTKRCLSLPRLAEEEMQKQPGKQAEGIYILLKLIPVIWRMLWCHRLLDSIRIPAN